MSYHWPQVASGHIMYWQERIKGKRATPPYRPLPHRHPSYVIFSNIRIKIQISNNILSFLSNYPEISQQYTTCHCKKCYDFSFPHFGIFGQENDVTNLARNVALTIMEYLTTVSERACYKELKTAKWHSVFNRSSPNSHRIHCSKLSNKSSPWEFSQTSGKCYINFQAEMTQHDTMKGSMP